MFEAHLVSFWVKTARYRQSFWVKKKNSNETFRTNFSNDCPYCLVLTQNDTKCASNIASSYSIRCDLGNNNRTSHGNDGLFWDNWYFIQKGPFTMCGFVNTPSVRIDGRGKILDEIIQDFSATIDSYWGVYCEIFDNLFKKGPFTMSGFVNKPSVRIDGRGKILDYFV